MKSAEYIPPVMGVVANETKVPGAANEGVFVSPDDLKRSGWWKNKDDVRVRVDADKFMLTDYSSGGQEILYGSLEEIAEKLRKEDFVFFPIEGETAQENSVRVSVRGEDVSKETAPDSDLEKRLVEDKRLDREIEQGMEDVAGVVEKIKDILSQAHNLSQEQGFEAIRAVLDDIISQVEGKIELINDVSSTDDIANKTSAVDEGYIQERQKRLEKLRGLRGEIDTLGEHAAQALESLKKLSAQAKEHDQEVPAIISGSDGDASGKLEKGSGKGDKPSKRERKGGKGGGSDGGDGGDDTDSTDVSPAEKRILKKKARLLEKQERREAEGVPVPTVDATTKEVVPSSETPPTEPEPVAAEASAPDTSWRKELDAFLERPKAREKVVMIEEIIQGEWAVFTERVATVASENQSFVSDREMMRLWRKYSLGDLEDIVAEYLDKNEGVSWQEGRAVFRAIVRNLEESSKNQE